MVTFLSLCSEILCQKLKCDSRHIYFVNQIVEYIVRNGMMKDLSVLQESPFTDQESVVEIFTDFTVWMVIRKVIDRLMLILQHRKYINSKG